MRIFKDSPMLKAFAAGAIVALLAGEMLVWADGDPATDQVPRLIPYHGTLERDGIPVAGEVTMKFRLYDSDSGDMVWEETQQVHVYNGRFAVMLGLNNDLSGVISAADDLELEVTLVDDGTEVPLSGRQKLLPVPYSFLSKAAADFHVSGNLTAQNITTPNMTINGILNMANDPTTTFKGFKVTTWPVEVGGAGTEWNSIESDVAPNTGVCFLTRYTHWAHEYTWQSFVCEIFVQNGHYALRVQKDHGDDGAATKATMTCLQWNW